MSENELGKKWDRCLADAAVKLGTGLGVGIVFSVLFFKTVFDDFTDFQDPQNIVCYDYRNMKPDSERLDCLLLRHTWPISLGSGVGLGMAYANCQNDLRSHYMIRKAEKET